MADLNDQALPAHTVAAPVQLRLSSARVACVLCAIIIPLTILSVASHVYRFTFAGGNARWYTLMFDLNYEHSVPTYYQGISILVASLLLVVPALSRRRGGEPHPIWWGILAAAFAWLSYDELCEMHEMVGFAVERHVHTSGYFKFGWVIPAMIFAATFGAIYLRFLFQLPLRTRLRFIVAGAIYVGGAVGVEMISAKYADLHGQENLGYCLISDVEEFGEMTGIGLFIFSLVSHLGQRDEELAISFSQASTSRRGKIAGDEHLSNPGRPQRHYNAAA